MNHQCRIAWSRSGLLAYIDNENNVCVTWLRCVDGEKWEYVPAVHVPYPSESKPVGLSWSASNFDLAIVDEFGRTQIVSISADGKPKTQIVVKPIRSPDRIPQELDKAVGIHWLSPDKNLIVPRPSQDPKVRPWESIASLGPFHPVKTRGALVLVSGNGSLRLLIQMPDFRYTEISSTIPEAQYVSHATFLQMGEGSLFLILANGENNLMVYEVVIKWNLDQLNDVGTEHTEPAKLSIRPVVTHSLLNNLELRGLVALRILGSDRMEIRAIYALRTLHFEIKRAEESLHNAFFELFSTCDPVQPAPYRVWNLSEPTVVDHTSEIIEYVLLRFFIVIVYKSGEYVTQSLISSQSNPQINEQNNILQFDQVGLGFKNEILRNAKSICFSPLVSCVAVFRDEDEELPSLHGVELIKPLNAQEIKNAAVALATGYACTVFNSEQCDDILKSCSSLLHHPHAYDQSDLLFGTLASETQRLLNVYLGTPDDPHKVERLVVIPSPSQRWLSFLVSLGTGKDWFRTPGCHTALGLLHLQLLAFGITWTLKRVSQKLPRDLNEQHRAEINASQYYLQSILGPAQWATDLIVRICQELYDVSMANNPVDLLVNKQNVYASLLTSNVSRYLLRYFLRGINTLSSAAKNLAEQETRLNSKLQQQAKSTQDAKLAQELKAKLALPTTYAATFTLKKLVTLLQSVPVKLDSFERLLVDFDTKLKALVVSQKLTVDRCNKIDSTLISSAQLPVEFSALVNPLVQSFKQVLLHVSDVPSMYFHDTAWLGLDAVPNYDHVDGLCKRSISPDEHMKVCTRCGINSILNNENAQNSPQWLVLFLRHCVCGGSWLRFEKMGTS